MDFEIDNIHFMKVYKVYNLLKGCGFLKNLIIKNYIKINYNFFFDIHTSYTQTQYLKIDGIFYEHNLLILIVKNIIYNPL